MTPSRSSDRRGEDEAREGGERVPHRPERAPDGVVHLASRPPPATTNDARHPNPNRSIGPLTPNGSFHGAPITSVLYAASNSAAGSAPGHPGGLPCEPAAAAQLERGVHEHRSAASRASNGR